MVVAVCRITLSIPGNDSLKGKRSVVKSVLERAKSRFNVAAAEVGALDAHTRAVLGFALVSNDTAHARSMVDKLAAFVEGAGEALVVDRQVELVHFGEELAG